MAWGMWRFAGADPATAQALVEAALDAGVTLFDTADIYGFGGPGFGEAEALLGRVLKAAPGLRRRMVLATKAGITPPVPYDSSADYLARALDESLRRLGTDRVELWQIHRPDILAHPQEVARALDNAHRAGKVGAVGVSNYTVAQTEALRAVLAVPLASVQPELSPLHLDPFRNGLAELAMTHDLALLAWSPLGGGRIAEPTDERGRKVAALLDEKAEEAGVDRSAACYSWIMAHPSRPVPIVGTQNVDRVRAIPQAFKPRWTRAEWYAVYAAGLGEKLP